MEPSFYWLFVVLRGVTWCLEFCFYGVLPYKNQVLTGVHKVHWFLRVLTEDPWEELWKW